MTTNASTKQNEVIFKSELLKDVVNMAKNNGYKVYAFQHNEKISQVFIVNNEGICSISADYFYGLNISTCHKPCRKFGKGFRLNEEPLNQISLNEINIAIRLNKPRWARQEGDVIKYSNWADYIKKNTILTYFEI